MPELSCIGMAIGVLSFELQGKFSQRGKIKALGEPGQLIGKPGVDPGLLVKPFSEFQQVVDITKFQCRNNLRRRIATEFL